MKAYRFMKQAVLLLMLIGIASASAYAERRHDRDARFEKHHVHDRRGGLSGSLEKYPKGYHLDSRYRHNHYYPAIGYHWNRLPKRHYVVRYHDRSYFYSSGIWYRGSSGLFVVVRPPFGAVVPVLPPFYTTIWAGGIPYYYANNVYYTWQPDRSGYVVTSPPADVSEQKVTPLSEQLYIYPKQGQSEKQQADDRYACHSWGVKQSGYDPSEPPSGTPAALASKREDYQRAMKACLEGRGYSVN
jgi:hypothetical protein